MNDINKEYDELLKVADTAIDDKIQLSDEEVDEICESMGGVKDSSKILQFISDMPSNNGDLEGDSELDNEEKTVLVDVNPITGEHVITGQSPIEKTANQYELITETFEEMLARAEETYKDDDLSNIKLSEDVIADYGKDTFGLSNQEILDFVKLVDDYRNGNHTNLYDRLPNKIKLEVDTSAVQSGVNNVVSIKNIKNAKNQLAKDLLESFVGDMTYNKLVIDFNEELNKIFNQSDKTATIMYTEMMLQREKQLDALYEVIKDEEPEKAKAVLDIKESIIESYTLKEFSEKINRIKIKKFDLEKPQKLYRDFDSKYTNSVYSIHSITLLYPILNRLFNTKYNAETIVKFLLAFCKYTMNMRPTKIKEHTFMYYFVTNIIYLTNSSLDTEDEFEKKVIVAIDNCMSKIA